MAAQRVGSRVRKGVGEDVSVQARQGKGWQGLSEAVFHSEPHAEGDEHKKSEAAGADPKGGKPFETDKQAETTEDLEDPGQQSQFLEAEALEVIDDGLCGEAKNSVDEKSDGGQAGEQGWERHAYIGLVDTQATKSDKARRPSEGTYFCQGWCALI